MFTLITKIFKLTLRNHVQKIYFVIFNANKTRSFIKYCTCIWTTAVAAGTVVYCAILPRRQLKATGWVCTVHHFHKRNYVFIQKKRPEISTVLCNKNQLLAQSNLSMQARILHQNKTPTLPCQQLQQLSLI
jgi:hypothetical protein